VPPEDGQVMTETVEALSFNKVKLNVNCTKLVRVVKPYVKINKNPSSGSGVFHAEGQMD
jgi:hypothetical protein